MKNIKTPIIALLVTMLSACDNSPFHFDEHQETHFYYNFNITEDLLDRVNPVFTYTDNYGKKQKIDITKNLCQKDENDTIRYAVYHWAIHEAYDKYHITGNIQLHFQPKPHPSLPDGDTCHLAHTESFQATTPRSHYFDPVLPLPSTTGCTESQVKTYLEDLLHRRFTIRVEVDKTGNITVGKEEQQL